MLERSELNQPSVNNLTEVRSQEGYITPVWSDESLSIAESGINDYRSMLQDPEIAQLLRGDPGIQTLFLGISAVQHFNADISEDLKSKLLAVLPDNYQFVSYKTTLSTTKLNLLVNRTAALKFINQNSDLFQGVSEENLHEFFSNPKYYLENANFFDATDLSMLRHGILSGYPKKTVENYTRELGIQKYFDRTKVDAYGVGDRKEGFSFRAYDYADEIFAHEALELRRQSDIALL